MQSEGAEKAERYRSGGLFSGLVGLAVVIGLLGYGVLAADDGFAPWVYSLLVLAGVLCWAILLRPAVVLHAEELELRNVLHSSWIPFGRIDTVTVKQFTVVEADDHRYVGSGFGRSRIAINRDARVSANPTTGQHSLGWLVEEKIRRRAKGAAEASGEPGPVRRTWAVPEAAALAVLALVSLVLALVA